MQFTGKRATYIGLLFLALAVVAIIPVYTSAYIHMLLTTLFMYAVLAVSWNIFCGPSRYISLGSTAFFGVGIYTAAVLGDTFPLLIIIVLGGLAAFLLALIVGLSTLRLRGIYFAVFTFGLGEFLRHTVLWYEINITSTFSRWIPMTEVLIAYYAMLILLLAALLTSYIIKSSKFGLALKSIGESEEATHHMGVNVTAVKVIFFAISCTFMGLAGAIIAGRWTYINPTIAFNPAVSFMVVLMVLVGGIGQVHGPLLGAAVLVIVSELLLVGFTYYYWALFGVTLIAVILFLPSGLLGLLPRKGVGKAGTFSPDSGEGSAKTLGNE